MDLEVHQSRAQYQQLEQEHFQQERQLDYRELITLSVAQFFGSLVFTYAIVACDNNSLGIMLVFSLALFITKNNPFNPAITLVDVFRGAIGVQEFWVSYVGQFMGSLIGGMVAYFTISPTIYGVPYQRAFLDNGLIGQIYGEVFGSMLFFCITTIQSDDYMKFTDDMLEENFIIVLALQAFRQLAFTSYSVFNPAIAISLEFFTSLKDGHWQRLEFIWVFLVGPIVGAFSAYLSIPVFYKYFFDKKMKYSIIQTQQN